MTAASNGMFVATARHRPAGETAVKLAGLSIAALFPAMFWTLATVGIGGMLGFTFALSSLLIMGSAIALFLGAVCAPIMLRA